MPELQPGTPLGKYVLQVKLGAGGMGEVWKARHSIIETREVAIKVMLPGSHLLEENVKRFIREASVLSGLGGHPHIVQIHDIDLFDDDRYFIVMEYVPDSLAKRLGDEELDGDTFSPAGDAASLLPLDEVIRIGREICLGLQAAHAQGVIHRDLKPENVLMTATGTAKLCDFGVALVSGVSRLTRVGLGSPVYTAPEVLRDAHSADARSDLYSLGAMLYRMTTGEIPMGVVTPPSDINPRVPQSLSDMILNCLKRQADRPASVDDVLPGLTGRPKQPAVRPVREPLIAPAIHTGPSIPADLRDLWDAHATRLKNMGFEIPRDQELIIRNEKDDGIALWVPPGEFLYVNAKERQTIAKGFYLDRYPITNAQYARFVSETGHRVPDCADWDSADWNTWKNGRPPSGYEDHPVVGVNWEDATAYSKWAGKRLPTGQEWEYAARGTDGREYPWGNEDPTPQLANYSDSKIGKTTPVGSYLEGASAFGFLDMAGNVWEWSNDPKSISKYDSLRGGSWFISSGRLRCAYRNRYLPGSRDYNIGFRVARL